MDPDLALDARLRAALRLLGNDDITPSGRRVLEKILDDVKTVRPAPPSAGTVCEVRVEADDD